MKLWKAVENSIAEIKTVEFIPAGTSIKYDQSFPETDGDKNLLVNLSDTTVFKFVTQRNNMLKRVGLQWNFSERCILWGLSNSDESN